MVFYCSTPQDIKTYVSANESCRLKWRKWTYSAVGNRGLPGTQKAAALAGTSHLAVMIITTMRPELNLALGANGKLYLANLPRVETV